MKMFPPKVKSERGFTLIEMLIVIAIIGIFLSLALPDYKGTVVKAQERSCKLTQQMILTALDSYYIDHNNQYPPGATAFQVLVDNHYLQSVPKCPGNGTISVKIAADGLSAAVTCSEHP
ncbi:competence type IV pilus major pilin ComGC [Aneurinibacillus terranovensis]|uniref:competence type IV pilus major pilin ComGC n=1 Tax=Aneurinibacillus terranovensis TaxID=278991 RepID=UPI0004252780|nr:type II secretion system protein [Aneurinibacillus terranovensis]